MSEISKLTKDEMINYLYVRDLVRGGNDNITEKLDYTNIEFHIYGAGPEQKQIEDFVNENETR